MLDKNLFCLCVKKTKNKDFKKYTVTIVPKTIKRKFWLEYSKKKLRENFTKELVSIISGSNKIDNAGINIPNPNTSKIIPINSNNVRITNPFLCLLVIKKFIFLSVLIIYNFLSSQLLDCILSPRISIKATFICSQISFSEIRLKCPETLMAFCFSKLKKIINDFYYCW